jgi:hypothetical protein
MSRPGATRGRDILFSGDPLAKGTEAGGRIPAPCFLRVSCFCNFIYISLFFALATDSLNAVYKKYCLFQSELKYLQQPLNCAIQNRYVGKLQGAVSLSMKYRGFHDNCNNH